MALRTQTKPRDCPPHPVPEHSHHPVGDSPPLPQTLATTEPPSGSVLDPSVSGVTARGLGCLESFPQRGVSQGPPSPLTPPRTVRAGPDARPEARRETGGLWVPVQCRSRLRAAPRAAAWAGRQPGGGLGAVGCCAECPRARRSVGTVRPLPVEGAGRAHGRGTACPVLPPGVHGLHGRPSEHG